MATSILIHFFKLFSAENAPAAPAGIPATMATDPNFTYLQEKAIVSETIQLEQPGRVRYRASWWSAICLQDVVLRPGTPVRVIGRSNLTLIVEPISLKNRLDVTSINAA